MRRVLSLLATLAMLAMLAVTTPPAGAARPVGTNQADPAVTGPWAVGYETFELVDSTRDGGRVLPVDVWYPVDSADAAGVGPAELDLFVVDLPLDIALDAPLPSAAGDFPLVVFSHGSGGFRAQSWFLMQHLASHGYVVVAPDHTGNTALDALFGTTLPGSVMAEYRPLDVSFVIDEMLDRSADPGDRFSDLIDADRIAVAGHSFGGYTALATAGGALDLDPDPRVDAIIPIAAASNGLTDAQLDAITVPTLFLSGTDDATVPLEPGTTRPWELLSSRDIVRVDVLAGGHSSFTNICELVDALLGAGLPPVLLQALIDNAAEGCAPDLIDIAIAQQLTNFYSVAFLDHVFHRGGPSRSYLTGAYARAEDLPIDLYLGRGASRRLVHSGSNPPLGS